jgi:hypothetical protein
LNAASVGHVFLEAQPLKILAVGEISTTHDSNNHVEAEEIGDKTIQSAPHEASFLDLGHENQATPCAI